MVFDNGSENPEGTRSRVVILNTKTNEIEWKYESWDQSSFFSHRQGSAQMLPNGNVFVTSANTGHLFEVTKKGEIAWDFVNPIVKDNPVCTIRDDDKETIQVQGHDFYFNMVHRAARYGKDYPGLKGKDLSPKGKLAPNCPEPLHFYKY